VGRNVLGADGLLYREVCAMVLAALVSTLPLAESFEPAYLEYWGILPLELEGDRLRVAAAAEPAREVVDDLALTYGRPVEVVVVSREEVWEGIRRTFAAAESVVELVRDLDAEVTAGSDTSEDGLADARDLANQPPVIRFVNLLIREASDARASDIHLESTRQGLSIRLRVDGVLTELPSPPKGLQAAVVSRIKMLAQLDIAERRPYPP
jgi:type II secretory ATPase GspE/PulE/Tfp pilus assembly ATPase PilB-like protein